MSQAVNLADTVRAGMAGELDPQLLEAGRRVFATHGYGGATVERIAKEAGLSRVTLHRRGVSKETILATLAERGIERYRAALWPALTAAGNGAERLRAALEGLCEAAEDNLEVLVALNSQTDAVFHETGEEVLTRDVFTEPLERLLRDGATDGSLRQLDPVETATVLFNLVGWTYIHLRTGHGWPPERASSGVLEIALTGVVARDQAE
jgi:AcrR family transcriptional regulator